MAFDKTQPVAGSYANKLYATIRTNNAGLESALDNEHDFTTGGTQTGRHAQGSARGYFQATAPATRIDGTSFGSADLGSIWIDSDDNKLYILTAATPTWTYIGTELFAALLAAARIFASTLGVTGDFAVNTDKFTVAAATGNTLVAGTLDVAGNIDPTTFETNRGGFKDEDDMVSDAANAVASQQSIKAHVAASSTDGYSPASYTGGESVTLPNGLIIKMADSDVTGTSETITFGTPFPNACIAVIASHNNVTYWSVTPIITAKSVSAFTVSFYHENIDKIYWIAIGY